MGFIDAFVDLEVEEKETEFLTFSDYIPHINQQKFHESNAKIRIIVAAIRSGKSYGFIHDIITEAWNNPTNNPVLVVAPTYKMAKDTIERPMAQILFECGLIPDDGWNKSDHWFKFNNGKEIVIRSGEEPDKIRGLTVYAAYIDEAAMCSREAVDIIYGRLLTTNGKLSCATTPKGMNNWVYEDFFSKDAMLEIKEKNLPVETFRFEIFNNPAITQEAFDALKAKYDPLFAKQELYGEFINLYDSLVYGQFDEEIHVLKDEAKRIELINNASQILIGVDWNINKYGTVCVVRTPEAFYIVDEIYGVNDVYDLSIAIKQKFPNKKIMIYSDAMNSQTNRLVLDKSGLSCFWSKSNPRRVERYNLVNAHLRNGLNQSHLFMFNNCKNLIKDLQMLCFKNNSDEPDTMGEKYGHITDALGYLIYHTNKENIWSDHKNINKNKSIKELIKGLK